MIYLTLIKSILGLSMRVTTVKNRIGERVGILTVIERAENKIEASKSGKNSVRAQWLCQCDCGNRVVVSGHNLNKALSNPNSTAGTRSCGCLMGKGGVKHGMAGSRTYVSWHSMVQRCTNPNYTSFETYGGRGITVCEKWKTFDGFYEDMGVRPPSLTLERRDVNKGYSKENCYWATMKQQGNNRRTNVLIEFNGKTQTLRQWADEIGLSPSAISNRLVRGWSIEKALSTPALKNQFT